MSRSKALLKARELIEQGISKLGSGSWDVERLSTGVPALDELFGGWPKGRLIEFFGLQGCGKSTLVYHALAANREKLPLVHAGFTVDDRKKGKPRPVRAILVDTEGSFDPERLEKLGFPREEIGIVQPDFGEQGLEAIETFAAAGVQFIALDGITGLIPASELEKTYQDDQQPGVQAKMYNRFFRRFPAWSSRPTLMCVNQQYSKIGAKLWQDPWATAGGQTLKYVASLRLQMKQRMKLKKGDRVLGHEVVVRVEKNKLGPSYGDATLYLVYKYGYVTPERWERIRLKRKARVEE